MITTVHVSVALTGVSHPEITVWDPRVLLAAQQVLAKRTYVAQAPDLLPGRDRNSSTLPVFAVALDDHPKTASIFDSKMATTVLLDFLTQPEKITVAFAEDGGWKVALLTLDFSVARL